MTELEKARAAMNTFFAGVENRFQNFTGTANQAVSQLNELKTCLQGSGNAMLTEQVLNDIHEKNENMLKTLDSFSE